MKTNLPNSLLRWLALGFASLLSAAAVEVDPNLPHYEPRPVTIPPDAGYLKPDGSILIVGAEEMSVGLKNLDALFTQTHPEIKFTTLLPGSSVGPAAILLHLAAFAVIDRVLLPEEVVPFQYMYKRPPLAFRVGRGSYSKLGYTTPMAICVNPDNPIEKLTTEQVARIFTVGGGKGDITTWGQLGLGGAWARRPIEVIGVRERTGEGVYMRTVHFGDYPYTPLYQELPSPDIPARLAGEAAGIALVGIASLPPHAKIVAIGETKDGYYSKASYEDVLAGRYPYASYTYFYLNHAPGEPFDPFVKEYLRMVLSKEGQEALTNEPNGFLPLSAKDATEELRKLEIQVDPALPAYQPVAPLTGVLTATGDDDMESLMNRWVAIFNGAHPGVEVKLDVGSSATAPNALAAGTSEISFVGRKMLAREAAKVTAAWGHEALPISVSGGTYDDREKTHAEMVWVNQSNPIAGLTFAQLDAIYGPGDRPGSSRPIKTWGELGLTGDWADQPVHALRNSAVGPSELFKETVLAGGAWGKEVRAFKEAKDVPPAVDQDPDAIGLSGAGFAQDLKVRAVALAAAQGDAAVAPTLVNVAKRTYPLSRLVYIYVNQAPGQALNPIVKEFLRAVLSKEGQDAAVQDGYLPLSPRMVREELAKLN